MTNLERTTLIDGKDMFAVNDGPLLNEPLRVKPPQYFGTYSVISLEGKKAVVLCDRKYKVNIVGGWYDDVLKMEWSDDHRFNDGDRPCFIMVDGKFNIIEPHTGKLLMKGWMKEITDTWFWQPYVGEYAEGIGLDGNEYVISTNGTITPKEMASREAIEKTLNKVRAYSTAQIKAEWIAKNLPCMFIQGHEYKGAKKAYIRNYEALKLIDGMHKHGVMRKASFIVYDNRVTLLISDYTLLDFE